LWCIGRAERGVPRRRPETGRLSVFRGREAKLNHAIFRALTIQSPQTAWSLFKQLKKRKEFSSLRYWVLIRRLHALREQDYVMKVGEEKTLLGSETALYQLTPRAELALALEKTDLDAFIRTAEYHRILAALEAFQNQKQ